MTLIDQRILIPAPVHVVWAVLADQYQLPKWRVDCQAMTILSSRQFGVGTRRRITAAAGKDRLEEITAWYEGLGYEYHWLENNAYKRWVSRLRLQNVPEGTIVQWEIEYETAGLFSKLGNTITGKAQLEEESADSLRGLLRLVKTSGANLDNEPRKRQTLQPVQSIVRSSTQPIMVPVDESAADTKPRRPEGLDEAIAAQKQAPPATGADAFRPPTPANPQTPSSTTSQVIPPVPTPNLQAKVPLEQESLPPGMPESLKATPPKGTPKVDLSRMRYADEVNRNADITPPPTQNLSTPASPPPTTQTLNNIIPPPTDMRDTGEISIWDAFGIRAPSQIDSEALDEIVKSQTGEYKAISIDEPQANDLDTMTFSPLLFETPRLQVRQPSTVAPRLRRQQARSRVPIRENGNKKT